MAITKQQKSQTTTPLRQESRQDVQILEGRIDSYKGGQLEIQNQGEHYYYRGEIKDVSIDKARNEINVKFLWLAKATSFDVVPSQEWIKDSQLDYTANLEIYGVSDIGQGRTAIYSSIVDELAVFFPKGGSRMERPFTD
ncbi:MAG: hypothetical protein ABR981_03235 [Candidatus Micrarchaeaceae archaeon]|jgi:hypothetical protein